MSWKQPTPTDIYDNENIDTLTRMIFFDIWGRVRRDDGLVTFIHNKRRYSVELKRGQCIYQVSKIAKEIKIDTKSVRRSIEILSKWYSQMESQAKPYGLILTFKNVDDMMKMESQMESQRIVRGESKDSQRRPKKNDKNDKSVENIYMSYKGSINSNARLTDGAKKKIQIRLKTFTEEELTQAIQNFSNDEWWMEHNAHRGVAWFFHSDERIEQFINLQNKVFVGRRPTEIELDLAKRYRRGGEST